MSARVYKAADVCEIAQLQPYVLRSWEKEFPGIGAAKDGTGPRVYEQADLDQILRIRELVFGQGLTLAGARRKLDGAHAPAPPAVKGPVLVAPGSIARSTPAATEDARERLVQVREGLRSLLSLLSSEGSGRGAGGHVEEYALQPVARASRSGRARKPANA